MVPPAAQITEGVYNQIPLLILYCINSKRVTLLKVIDAPVQCLIIFTLLSVSSSFILAFRYSLFLFLKCTLASYLTLFKKSSLIWFGSCNYCILACFLWFKKPQKSSSNHGLCCFHSYTPRLSLAEVLIFTLMFSQAQFMSPLSFKFSKAVNLFEVLI